MSTTADINALANSLVYQFIQKVDKTLAQEFQKKTKAKPCPKNSTSLIDILSQHKKQSATQINAKSSDDSSEEEPQITPTKNKVTPAVNGKPPTVKKKQESSSSDSSEEDTPKVAQ
ncbi:hypothetical protein EVAR_71341_1, partial [Eumeta japonica]